MIQKTILLIFFITYSLISFAQDKSVNNLDDSCKMIPSLIPIKLNGKWGYCDRMKKVKIKAEFEEANPFESINYKGKLKSKSDLYATVKKGNKFYRIDKNGIAVEQIDTSKIQNDEGFEYTLPYLEKIFEIFKENNLYGVKDLVDNKVIIPPIYNYISPFEPTLSLPFPFKVKKDGKFGVVRQDGKIIIPVKYDQLEQEYYYWSRIRIILATNKTNKYYVDYCGNEYKK